MHDLLIEYLPGELTRLIENDATVLRISVVAEIRAFIDEAFTLGVDHDAERIGVFLESVANGKVAMLGRVAIPPHRVTARPVARGPRADIERHLNSAAGVEARSPYLREIPRRAEIARAPLGIGFKNPPLASTTALARMSRNTPLCLTRTPCTPLSSVISDSARVSNITSMPSRAADLCNASTSPGPPPHVSTVNPPQILIWPSILSA